MPQTTIPLQIGDRVRWASVLADRNRFTSRGEITRISYCPLQGVLVDARFWWDSCGGVWHETTREPEYVFERIEE